MQKGIVSRLFPGLAGSPEDLGLDTEREVLGDDGCYRCRTCGAVTLRTVRNPSTGETGWVRFRCGCESDEEKELRAEKERIEAESERSRITALKEQSGVFRRFLNASFDSVVLEGRPKAFSDACSFLRELAAGIGTGAEGIPGCYISGTCGMGKTLIASAAANAVMESGHSALFLPFDGIFERISSAWSRGGEETEHAFMKRIYDADVVFFDDFAQVRIATVQGVESWKRDVLFHVINTRYNSGRPTVFTSNIPFEGLQSMGYPAPIIERVMEMAPVRFAVIGKTYRGQVVCPVEGA